MIVRTAEFEGFTIANVAMIADAVGLPLVANDNYGLARELNRIAAQLISRTLLEAEDTPKVKAAIARRVVDACDELKNSIRGNADSGVLESLGPGAMYALAARESGGAGEGEIDRILSDVVRLRGWARIMEATHLEQPHRRRTKSRAFARFVQDVEEVYLAAFHAIPARSTSAAGQQGGPFVRFLLSVHSTIVAGSPVIHRRTGPALVQAWRRERIVGHELGPLVAEVLARDK